MAQQRDSFSFIDAMEGNYLPGEYYRRGLSTLDPTQLAKYHARLRWDFREPKMKSSTDQFMAIASNPSAFQNLLYNRLPSDFVGKLQQFGGLSGFSEE